jgi:hypothetical protein
LEFTLPKRTIIILQTQGQPGLHDAAYVKELIAGFEVQASLGQFLNKKYVRKHELQIPANVS